jgi:hypothetical protein
MGVGFGIGSGPGDLEAEFRVKGWAAFPECEVAENTVTPWGCLIALNSPESG